MTYRAPRLTAGANITLTDTGAAIEIAASGGGAGITALTGDVTASGTGSVAATIAAEAVTYAKMQNVSAAARVLGRGSAGGAGDVEEITLGTNLSMSGTTLNATGGSTGTVTFIGNTASGSDATSSMSLNDLQTVFNIDGTDIVLIDQSTVTFNVSPTFGTTLIAPASVSGGASLRAPHGTAPSSPVNGDVWTTTAGMYVRINGATVGPLAAAGGSGLTQPQVMARTLGC